MMRRPASVARGLALYAGYLLIFFTVWTINGADYNRIGQTLESTRLWYATPTLAGGAFLVVALTYLGWWRAALFEPARSGPAWVWVLPVAVAAVVAHNLLSLPWDKLSAGLLLWSVLGGVGVGFGEEMITRGSLIVGLRSRHGEVRVWLISTAMFSALHAPNVLFGLPLEVMPIQLLLTFIMGSGFYVMRRISGTLLLPMLLHGLWDSALFLHVAAGVPAHPVQFVVYPLAIVCAAAVLWRERRGRI